MVKVYAIDGVTPVVDPTAYVHPSAVLIGDVIVGPRCYVGPCASLRGDLGRIVLEAGSNLQDTCVMHSFPGMDVSVGENGHIGHGAILHGCRIGPGALVGMNSVVMDDADIGESSIVGAMSFVKAGTVVPPRSLIAGIPARVVRELTEQEIAWKTNGTYTYHDIAARSLATMTLTEALTAVEADRQRVKGRQSTPLHKLKA